MHQYWPLLFPCFCGDCYCSCKHFICLFPNCLAFWESLLYHTSTCCIVMCIFESSEKSNHLLDVNTNLQFISNLFCVSWLKKLVFFLTLVLIHPLDARWHHCNKTVEVHLYSERRLLEGKLYKTLVWRAVRYNLQIMAILERWRCEAGMWATTG